MNIVIHQLQQNKLKAEKQLTDLTEFRTAVLHVQYARVLLFPLSYRHIHFETYT